jgi:hypothetical protein
VPAAVRVETECDAAHCDLDAALLPSRAAALKNERQSSVPSSERFLLDECEVAERLLRAPSSWPMIDRGQNSGVDFFLPGRELLFDHIADKF